MNLETFKKAVDSLADWPKVIGLIGGNTALHPQIKEFTEYFVEKIPKKEREASGHQTSFAKKNHTSNYGVVYFNSHDQKVVHQPILCASKDIVKDKAARDKLISACWLAEQWSPSITPKGCYRCEVMGAFDMALNYNLGLPIEPGWWDRHFLISKNKSTHSAKSAQQAYP